MLLTEKFILSHTKKFNSWHVLSSSSSSASPPSTLNDCWITLCFVPRLGLVFLKMRHCHLSLSGCPSRQNFPLNPTVSFLLTGVCQISWLATLNVAPNLLHLFPESIRRRAHSMHFGKEHPPMCQTNVAAQGLLLLTLECHHRGASPGVLQLWSQSEVKCVFHWEKPSVPFLCASFNVILLSSSDKTVTAAASTLDVLAAARLTMASLSSLWFLRAACSFLLLSQSKGCWLATLYKVQLKTLWIGARKHGCVRFPSSHYLPLSPPLSISHIWQYFQTTFPFPPSPKFPFVIFYSPIWLSFTFSLLSSCLTVSFFFSSPPHPPSPSHNQPLLIHLSVKNVKTTHLPLPYFH